MFCWKKDDYCGRIRSEKLDLKKVCNTPIKKYREKFLPHNDLYLSSLHKKMSAKWKTFNKTRILIKDNNFFQIKISMRF